MVGTYPVDEVESVIPVLTRDLGDSEYRHDRDAHGKGENADNVDGVHGGRVDEVERLHRTQVSEQGWEVARGDDDEEVESGNEGMGSATATLCYNSKNSRGGAILPRGVQLCLEARAELLSTLCKGGDTSLVPERGTFFDGLRNRFEGLLGHGRVMRCCGECVAGGQEGKGGRARELGAEQADQEGKCMR